MSLAAFVDRASDEFLARSGLAQQQHRSIGGRHHLDELKHVSQARTLTYDSGKSRLIAVIIHFECAEICGCPVLWSNGQMIVSLQNIHSFAFAGGSELVEAIVFLSRSTLTKL